MIQVQFNENFEDMDSGYINGTGRSVTDRSALAFEFSMDGQFNWEYDMRGQTGSNGFFGPYDEDAGSGATYTPGTVTSVIVPGPARRPLL